MKKHALLLMITVVLCTFVPAAADILYLNEGEEHTGKLLTIDRDTVTFDELGSGVLKLPAASVTNVLLSTLRKGDEIQTIASLTDPVAIGVLSDLPSPASYPNSDFVTLFRQRRFTVRPDGSFDLERREIVQILKEPGLGKADQAAFYQTRCLYCHPVDAAAPAPVVPSLVSAGGRLRLYITVRKTVFPPARREIWNRLPALPAP